MRVSLQLVVFLILLNGAAGAITASGAADALNIGPNPGGDEVTDIENRPGTLGSEAASNEGTLYTLYSSVTRAFDGVIALAFYGPIMLENLGIPSWITQMFSGVVTLIVTVDVIYLLTGRDM